MALGVDYPLEKGFPGCECANSLKEVVRQTGAGGDGMHVCCVNIRESSLHDFARSTTNLLGENAGFVMWYQQKLSLQGIIKEIIARVS